MCYCLQMNNSFDSSRISNFKPEEIEKHRVTKNSSPGTAVDAAKIFPSTSASLHSAATQVMSSQGVKLPQLSTNSPSSFAFTTPPHDSHYMQSLPASIPINQVWCSPGGTCNYDVAGMPTVVADICVESSTATQPVTTHLGNSGIVNNKNDLKIIDVKNEVNLMTLTQGYKASNVPSQVTTFAKNSTTTTSSILSGLIHAKKSPPKSRKRAQQSVNSISTVQTLDNNSKLVQQALYDHVIDTPEREMSLLNRQSVLDCNTRQLVEVPEHIGYSKLSKQKHINTPEILNDASANRKSFINAGAVALSNSAVVTLGNVVSSSNSLIRPVTILSSNTMGALADQKITYYCYSNNGTLLPLVLQSVSDSATLDSRVGNTSFNIDHILTSSISQ